MLITQKSDLRRKDLRRRTNSLVLCPISISRTTFFKQFLNLKDYSDF